MKAYLDPAAVPQERAKDLLLLMTLDEKIAQIGSTFAAPLLENGKFARSQAENVLKNGIGQISAPAMSSSLAPRQLCELMNDIQRYLFENTRLAIPAMVHEECLNGFRAKGATIFPQNIGLAASWEPDLAGRITNVIRRQMRAAGMHQGLAPVLDVARDPRWGRVEETFGEDPYLVAALGLAYVKGLQGNDNKQGIVATLKHFAGHGLPESGLNCAPSHIPPRLLREVYLHPFKKAVKQGGVLSVMNAYHEIDGIPCAASEELLTDILRREWGFEGVVVSDYFAIAQLMTIHKVAAHSGEAAALALKAGIDIELPFSNCYAEPLQKAVENGTVPIELVDRAVARILALKFKLGLFENPYVDPQAAIEIMDTMDDRRLALEAARKSIVLLKNDKSILPLSKTIRNIAVIGPNADSLRNLLGDYTFPAHAAHETKKDEKTGQEVIIWKDKDAQTTRLITPEVVSILDGIKAAVSNGCLVRYARGCGINDASVDGFDDAIKTARAADIAIVVVGDKSGLMPDDTSGEMRDRFSLKLPGVQEDLVKAIYETGTPLVLVLVNGRPIVMPWIANTIPAIIEAWLPGEEGGRAVSDVLFGDYNPGGKLPVSFPQNEGQIPIYYGRKPSGRKSTIWTDYVEGPAAPLYEFGYGLSYTTFEFSGLVVEPARIGPEGACSIQFSLRNTGQREGSEVVQLYINDVVASVTRPVKELKAFERIYLKPGESKTVTFKITADELAFYHKNMQKKVEAGVFKVMIGPSSSQIRLEGEFELTA
jgi:beta-glucosidase